MGVSPLYTLINISLGRRERADGFEREGIVDRSLGCTLPRFSRMRSESRVSVCQLLRESTHSLFSGVGEGEREEELIVLVDFRNLRRNWAFVRFLVSPSLSSSA